MSSTIEQLIKTYSTKSPEALAISAPNGFALTYRELHQNVVAIASQISAAGFGRNDRIACVLPNGPELAITFLGISSCATFAPLNPAYTENELEHYLTDLAACAIVLALDDNSSSRTVAHKLEIPVIDSIINPSTKSGLVTPSDRSAGPPEFSEPDDIALVLHTSGTTSKPKIVPLKVQNLVSSADNIAGTLRLTAADRCLNVMPLFHIHGLSAAILATIASGGSVQCMEGFSAPHFIDWIISQRATWYTAVPSMHQSILANASATQTLIDEIGLRFIRSSSAALPPKVMQGLEELFDVPVIEAYGMTEAAHQMTSNPLPPGERKAGSVGIASNIDVAIMAVKGADLLPADEPGEIVIKGPSVMTAYSNNAQANDEAFVQDWFRTGDLGYLDADGYLFITGRIKEIINRGGEKISPLEVEDVLLRHPAVSQAVAFAIPHETLGEEIAAAVVAQDENVSSKELQKFVDLRLAQFKVPRQVIFMDEIPKGPTGKVQRIGLADKLELRPIGAASKDQSGDFIAPRNATEKALAAAWAELLETEDISVNQRFQDLGGDSLLATRLISRLSDTLDIELSLVDFFDAPTIADQAAVVEELLLLEMDDSAGSPIA